MKEETVLSAHPVSDDMRATVVENLAALERTHQVKVLFACESGSRGWGSASPDSDYDVRFVYVNRLPWYLTVEPGRDVIEQPISGEASFTCTELTDHAKTNFEVIERFLPLRFATSACNSGWRVVVAPV